MEAQTINPPTTPTATPAPEEPRTFWEKGYQWPLMIFGLLACTAILDVTFLVLASQHSAVAAEEDYYERAQMWDETRAAARAADALGWSIDLRVAPAADPHMPVALGISALDAKGEPLTGARVALRAFHHAHPRDALARDLAPLGEGRYATELPMHWDGLWEVEVEVQHGEHVVRRVFTESVVRTQ